NRSQLQVTAGVLSAGNTYVFEAAVYPTGYASYNSTDTIKVVVTEQAVVAVITGGDRTVGTQNVLALDGSSSKDPDYSSMAFNYTWSCLKSGVTCTTAAGVTLFLGTASTASLAASTMGTGTYTFSLLVTKGSRNSTASVSITYLAGAPPAVTIDALSASKYSPASGTYLQLTGRATFTSSVDFAWSIFSGDGDSSTIIVQKWSIGFVANAVIDLYQLTAGTTYVFKLTATSKLDSTSAGSSTVNVVVNSPPSSGSLEVSPTTGTALTTAFSMLASSWVDDADDFPLQYKYGYVLGSSYSGSGATIIRPYSLSSPASSILQAGNATTGNVVTCIVFVADKYGASSYATAQVTVSQPVVEAAALTTYLATAAASLLDTALQAGDPDATVQMASILAASINSASSQS
ncbi:unnamed protein product, partial [Phaeothamnion confervicola]